MNEKAIGVPKQNTCVGVIRSFGISYAAGARMTASPRLFIAKSKIDGRGCFAAIDFHKRQKVAELAGERVGRAEARKRIGTHERIRICDVDGTVSIDAGRNGDETAFINHSCDPNLFMRVQRGHVLFFALRDIRAGDELSLDYGESHHDGRRRCRCGAANCRGAI
jgi:SET domain-containing protein